MTTSFFPPSSLRTSPPISTGAVATLVSSTQSLPLSGASDSISLMRTAATGSTAQAFGRSFVAATVATKDLLPSGHAPQVVEGLDA
ncbi:hypothetical protein QE381_001474 [Microbacterium sp. SORGH_AS 888]|nr:hypothetical protein [Microbacterium sp. SORGH_AS_0888]MDQ1129346.1 hypothetical protein [Microbacterium sp. SORGH_AS_0888]